MFHLIASDLYQKPADNVEELVKQYDNILRDLLDKHAPERKKKVVERSRQPWMNDKILNAKKKRRKMERKWRKSRLTVFRQAYEAERNNVHDEIKKAKTDYYNNKVADCNKDQKKLFHIVNTLLSTAKPSALPEHDALGDLVANFSEFFQGKIETIRMNLADLEATVSPLTCPPVPDLLSKSKESLSIFTPASEEEVCKAIKSSSKATCSLDPVPTKLLVDHLLPELLPVITKIVNSSLAAGYLPDSLKMALVKPLLKKMSLDPNILKNFRPVSNLSFLSKIIEKIVAKRLNKHMADNGLHDILQSAYKPGHSTETALLKVQSDILSALDKKSGVYLALIDLSAAFDTVDHDILLSFLNDTIGINDAALNWFKSYLTNRTQQVEIDGVLSDPTNLKFGVPQGSVLGPLKFCIYTLPIGAIIKAHGLQYHIYADDTQVYLSFDLKNPEHALQKLNACLADIRSWMISNKLKINDDKTEFLIIGSKHTHSNLKSSPELLVGNSKITPSASARNLGATFDQYMSMEQHVTNTSKSVHFHLRNIGSLRGILTESATTQLVHSLISSRLDYCNSLLKGIPDSQVQRLQRLQNHAARIVSRVGKFDHIQPVLKKLHWLPVKERIDFKVLLLTHKSLLGKAPAYLANELMEYKPSRTLRSQNQQLLEVPKSNSKSFGDRTFYHIAPKMWNTLPLELRNTSSTESFKKQLKTYLFRKAYGQ